MIHKVSRHNGIRSFAQVLELRNFAQAIQIHAPNLSYGFNGFVGRFFLVVVFIIMILLLLAFIQHQGRFIECELVVLRMIVVDFYCFRFQTTTTSLRRRSSSYY